MRWKQKRKKGEEKSKSHVTLDSSMSEYHWTEPDQTKTLGRRFFFPSPWDRWALTQSPVSVSVGEGEKIQTT